MGRNKLISLILVISLLVLIPLAMAWTPPSDIDLRNFYEIYNATAINATDFYQNTYRVLDTNSTLNASNVNGSELNVNSSTYWDDETSQANLNVNSSTYWDDETTQANLSVNNSVYWDDETSQANLNVNSSTYWDDETSQANLNVNSSTWWAGITNFLSNTWFYNSANNLTFNETKLNTTIEGVITTQESSLNVNSSDYWDNKNTPSDLNNLILSDWANISNEPTNLSEFTDDLDYSTKNVNSSDYWDDYNTASDLNNLITIQGENISGGTIDFARLPSLTNLVISDWANITNKFITAVAGRYLYMSGSTLNLNDTLLNSTFQFDVSADCSGTEFVKGILPNGTLNCTIPAGSGDITGVWTNGTYLSGGGASGDLDIRFNTTAGVADWGNWSADQGDYYTSAVVDTLGNWSADKGDYYTSAIVDTLGNWSADKGDYYTSAVVDTLGNWSADKGDYYTSTQVDNFDYMQDVVNDTTPTLGGNLDANSNNISNLDLINSTGVGTMTWNGSAWLIVGTTAEVRVN